jgi:hypothetical protein
MWNDGVKATRIICRLADAWQLFLKQVFWPIGLPMFGFYALFPVPGRFPSGLSPCSSYSGYL